LSKTVKLKGGDFYKMLNRKQIVFLSVGLMFFLTSTMALAADNLWQTDFAAAKAKAAKSMPCVTLSPLRSGSFSS